MGPGSAGLHRTGAWAGESSSVSGLARLQRGSPSRVSKAQRSNQQVRKQGNVVLTGWNQLVLEGAWSWGTETQQLLSLDRTDSTPRLPPRTLRPRPSCQRASGSGQLLLSPCQVPPGLGHMRPTPPSPLPAAAAPRA